MSHAPELVDARYGGNGALPPTAALNPVLETLLAHRSVRSFLPDALPDHTIETLVSAAQSAPSSSNLQAWSVIAVESQERRDRLAELTGGQAHVRQAPLFLAWLADLSRIERIAAREGRQADGLAYLDSFLVAVVDAALAAQNALVAAESLGLGTVYIGALRNRPEDVAQLLGTPHNVFPVFGLVVGHPDPARPADVKPRLPQPVVLHREQYRVPADAAAETGGYEATLHAFQERQGMARIDWSTQVIDRLRDASTLKGRHRLVEALNAAGFGLR